MKKIVSLFKRDYQGTRLVYNEVVEGAEWVIVGEGVATEKIDGTSCLWKDGKLWKRYDAKGGKTPPDGWIAAQDPDPITGHHPGWIPVSEHNPEDRWHREALQYELERGRYLIEGATYELVGLKIQGNPYRLDHHELWQHGKIVLGSSLSLYPDPPRDFDGLKAYFERYDGMEGIVWHRANGDMVKIKRRDFGFQWNGR